MDRSNGIVLLVVQELSTQSQQHVTIGDVVGPDIIVHALPPLVVGNAIYRFVRYNDGKKGGKNSLAWRITHISDSSLVGFTETIQ
jgi:hypothetical protein